MTRVEDTFVSFGINCSEYHSRRVPDIASQLSLYLEQISRYLRRSTAMDETKAAFAEASGTIGSRFESQKTVDEARERKDREWKDAYARWVESFSSGVIRFKASPSSF